MTLEETLQEYTRNLDNKGLLRVRAVSQPAQSKDLIFFDSNDYLSLTQDQRIATAYQEGYKQFPSGSGSSMLVSGYHQNHQAVERAFSEFLDVDDCVLFSSGYAANLALAGLLGRLNVTCFIDKSVHASIYDGLKLAQVPFVRYAHNNLEALKNQLSECTTNIALITEGIFSMSGQSAHLSHISELTDYLFVDEAHSIGIMGDHGRGAVDHHRLTQNQVPLRTVALGKAFAAQGALIAGKKAWIQALIQAGRSLTYSTAISPALAYGLLKTLEVVAAADDRRAKLNELIAHFNHCAVQSPLIWRQSDTAIQQLQLGCPRLAVHYSKLLRKRGFVCTAIRSPTVSVKETGLRIILNSCHNTHQINQLFNHLHAIHEHQYY